MERIKSKEFVNNLSEQSHNFCIIGLTGKIKSGTADVCSLLTSLDFCDYVTQPANTEGFTMSEIREHKVVYRYLHHHWRPFIDLSVASVIMSFLMDSDIIDVQEDHYGKIAFKSIQTILEKKREDFQAKLLNNVKRTIHCIRYEERKWSAHQDAKQKGLEDSCIEFFQSIRSIKDLWDMWHNVKDKLYKKDFTRDVFFFCFGLLPVLEGLLKPGPNVAENDGRMVEYTPAFQYFGNNVRATGKAVCIENSGPNVNAESLFILPERINQFIKVLRHDPFSNQSLGDSNGPTGGQYLENKNVTTFVVINNFKNIFEAYYFKRRYSVFYLLAVSCDEKAREAKFENISDFKMADLKENLSSGKKLFQKAIKYIDDHKEHAEQPREYIEQHKKTMCEDMGINLVELGFIKDIFTEKRALRKIAYEAKIAPFVLQDVMTCIENADIFVTRDHSETDYHCDYPLIRSLGRIITLILHPGLLTPTKLERCMQIAMTAKLNSGCLSRQVGAVVTDGEYNILSLGWNDAPCGVESCIRRNFFDLLRKHDPEAYSSYELDAPEFRNYLEKINLEMVKSKSDLNGLPMAFCFKDIYQDIIKQRDQIYTRALHGEERALSMCGNERAKGGYLFTTSSPCELCAKKAKEANISKIYYIEQYPGISHTHVIDVGDQSMRARYEFFVGAVGGAYVKLYTPIIPYKDELAAFDFSVVDVHKKIVKNGSNAGSDVIDSNSCEFEEEWPDGLQQIRQDEQ